MMIKYTFYSHSKAEAIISNIQKFLGKGSGWIIDSVLDHNKELYHPRNGVINIRNLDDNQCFK